MSNNDLRLGNKFNIDTTFKWKTKDDEFIYPKDMPTRHLFYTLRMIWNHTMPKDAKLTPYKQYKLGNYYNIEYLSKAIYNIYSELVTRPDIKYTWMYDLQFMYNWILKCENLEDLTKQAIENNFE